MKQVEAERNKKQAEKMKMMKGMKRQRLGKLTEQEEEEEEDSSEMVWRRRQQRKGRKSFIK
jgi:hypothetical protein